MASRSAGGAMRTCCAWTRARSSCCARTSAAHRPTATSTASCTRCSASASRSGEHAALAAAALVAALTTATLVAALTAAALVASTIATGRTTTHGARLAPRGRLAAAWASEGFHLRRQCVFHSRPPRARGQILRWRREPALQRAAGRLHQPDQLHLGVPQAATAAREFDRGGRVPEVGHGDDCAPAEAAEPQLGLATRELSPGGVVDARSGGLLVPELYVSPTRAPVGWGSGWDCPRHPLTAQEEAAGWACVRVLRRACGTGCCPRVRVAVCAWCAMSDDGRVNASDAAPGAAAWPPVRPGYVAPASRLKPYKVLVLMNGPPLPPSVPKTDEGPARAQTGISPPKSTTNDIRAPICRVATLAGS
eukprot:7383756-Prymnesium_polylepis.1